MGEARDPIEQFARELAREAGKLPARWQLWLFEWLRDDLLAVDAAKHAQEQELDKMAKAGRALEQVAAHRGLRGREEQLALTMDEFDQAPDEAREGLKARQLAKAYRGSWHLAKAVAYDNYRFESDATRKQRHQRELARTGRVGAQHLESVREWLAAEPEQRSRRVYDEWRQEHNRTLEPGQKRAVASPVIRDRWQTTWAEVVAAAEEDRLPEAVVPTKRVAGDPDALEAMREAQVADPRDFIDDPALRARRIRAAREAYGVSATKLSREAGLGDVVVRKLETGEQRQTMIGTLIRLSKTLGISLDLLATDDGGSGYPPRPEKGWVGLKPEEDEEV